MQSPRRADVSMVLRPGVFMTAQTLAIIVGCYSFIAAMIFMSLFDLFRQGGTRELKRELEAEVEQGVKLLDENAELRAVCTRYEKMLMEHRDVCPVFHLGLAPSADSFPAQENVGAVAGNLSADVSPVFNCDLCYLHVPHTTHGDDV